MAVFDSETTVAEMQPDVALLVQLDCRMNQTPWSDPGTLS
jgi:hypothetical protein